MKIINYEFKAIARDLDKLEDKLLMLNPIYKGEDHQTDTYFNIPEGRLKLREGNIENALIYYERPNHAAAKISNVILYEHAPSPGLKDILVKVHGVKVVVDKRRKIYFIDNVKFHFDTVKDLGTFVEAEARGDSGHAEIEKLKAQCDYYFSLFELSKQDSVQGSYSDLLLEKLSFSGVK